MSSGEDGLGPAPDDLYEALIQAHAGLTEADSAALDARLVLLLMNEVGDPARVHEIVAIARASLGP